MNKKQQDNQDEDSGSQQDFGRNEDTEDYGNAGAGAGSSYGRKPDDDYEEGEDLI